MEAFEIEGVKHKGRDLLDVFERHVRLAFSDKEKQMIYLRILYGIYGQVNIVLYLVNVL